MEPAVPPQPTSSQLDAPGLLSALMHNVPGAIYRGALDSDWTMELISADGRGGAQPSAGSGLQGLEDRLAALGGRLELDSPPGAGTLLRARVPRGVAS